MPQTKTYYSQQVREIYFNLLKIVSQNQKDEWCNYSRKAGCVKDDGGILTFQRCLDFYNNQNTEVWVAYVSNQTIIDPHNLDKSGIEMYMSVTTSEHAPFTTHMGIQRVPCEKSHKNIAVLLHEFCAKIMHECYPNKLFMINTPQEVMRDILFNALKAKGAMDKVAIHDTNYYNITPEFLCRQEADITALRAAGVLMKSTVIPDLHLKQILFERREQIKKGNLFPGVSIDEKSESVTFKDQSTGKELSVIRRGDPEFAWVFENYDLFMIATDSSTCPMISVDLVALATLSDQFSQEH